MLQGIKKLLRGAPTEAERRKAERAARERELSGANDAKTFDFGCGPVAAARHRNPRTASSGARGGWVACSATCGPGVELSPDSCIFGHAKVVDQARILLGSKVSDSARVTGSSEVANCRIGGESLVESCARVWGATAEGKVTLTGKVLGLKSGEERLIVERDIPAGFALCEDGLRSPSGKLLPDTKPRRTP